MKKLKTNLVKVILLINLAIEFINPSSGNAVEPTFVASVKNFQFQSNILYFDIYLEHTNLPSSGQFELALNEYHFNFNPLIANGGTLSYTIVPGSTQFSNPNAVPRNPRIVGNQLNLASNAHLGAGNGPIINSTPQETRVVTMKLSTTAASFAQVPLSLIFRNGPQLPYTKIFAYINNTSTDITANGTYLINNPNQSVIEFEIGTGLFVGSGADVSADLIIFHGTFSGEGTINGGYGYTLNLTATIEGFYNSSSNIMVPDSVIVYLRNALPPYANSQSAKSVLDNSGIGNFSFFNVNSSTSYYIVIKHRNSIETWSSSAITFSSQSLAYDFTSAANKAFGSNQIQIDNSPVKFAIYSGDVNQDGIIDGTDASLIDNDASNFITGYVPADLDGNDFVDGSDGAIADNNAFNFVTKIVPPGAGPQAPFTQASINEIDSKIAPNQNLSGNDEPIEINPR